MARIGDALAEYAQPLDGDERPQGIFANSSLEPSVERAMFNEHGVSALVDDYTVDEMVISERAQLPASHEAFDALIPAEATAWQAGFYVWGNWAGSGYQHSYFKVRWRGYDHIELTAYSPSPQVAEQIMRAGRSIIREYPPEIVLEHRPPFKVFIAYGGGRAWEVVRDYLTRAEIEVDAFTETERVSRVTIDVVSEMIYSASMAVIVMTGVDQHSDGTKHARENVIHEAGFAQGALGIRNTLILAEDDVVVPSNLAGVTYIPFAVGEIHTTAERVIARIKEAKADNDAGRGFRGPQYGMGGC